MTSEEIKQRFDYFTKYYSSFPLEQVRDELSSSSVRCKEYALCALEFKNPILSGIALHRYYTEYSAYFLTSAVLSCLTGNEVLVEPQLKKATYFRGRVLHLKHAYPSLETMDQLIDALQIPELRN